MDSKFKDSPSEKLDVRLKQNFSPDVVDEFFACVVKIYNVKEWTDLYVRKADGREFNVNMIFAYSDTLTFPDTKSITDFIFKPPILKSESG
jgi:hypothetical protein